MRNFFGSPAKKLRTVDDVEDYLNEEEGSVVAFLDKDDKERKENYMKVAMELRGIGFYFGYATNPDIRQKYPQYDNKIVHIRANILDSAYEDKISIYKDTDDDDKTWNTTLLTSWCIKQQQGMMGFRSSANEFLFRFVIF